MYRTDDSGVRKSPNEPGTGATHNASGWETATDLVREYDRPVSVGDAVHAAVIDAAEAWPEVSDEPPLQHFVDIERLDGLFKTKATDDSGWLPSVSFRFQGCQINVLYGAVIRVIIDREP
ncbi:HalOD1 output domain-containing protein [Halorientalis sp.]|uniref:HalOD1 output domain-containing protein n=1 Tax=Halorientalis sp. TaxID=1931229 RepID=UPI00263564A4|nr:HalOD1 output domain-containing protein [Halorientalis sp.]